MQRGITSYFKPSAPPKQTFNADDDDVKSAAKKKRTARVISSDEEDVPATPKAATKAPDHKRKRLEEKSPSVSKSATKKPSLSKLKFSPKKTLKPVDPAALFGGETLRVEAARPAPPTKPEVIIDLDDDEIDTSIMEIDLQELEKVHGQSGKERRRSKSKSKTPNKDSAAVDNQRTPTKSDKTVTTSSVEQKHSKSKTPRPDSTTAHHHHRTPKKSEDASATAEKEQHKSSKTAAAASGSKEDKNAAAAHSSKDKNAEAGRSLKDKHADATCNAKEHTPKTKPERDRSTSKPKTKHHDDLESSVLSDEDRHERKRMSAILYQKFKNRASVINPGSKEVPKGTPNCLAGCTFLVTGVLESLERDEAGSIIKEYGGKLMTTVGKRLNYLIVGEEAGPKKLAQAEEFGVKVISEDGLFDLIRKKSGGATNGKIKEEQPSKSPKSQKRKEEAEVKIKKEPSSHKKPKLDKKEAVVESNNNNKVKIKEEKTQEQRPPVEFSAAPRVKPAVSDDMLAWVDKYKPTNVKDIVGQFGPTSNATKLSNWLSKWYSNHDGKKKLQRPNPWAKSDDGSFYKAALLSGPPGIGKTTTATLVCRELGFDAVEFNASDTRSKRLLKEEVAELLSNKSLYDYFHGEGKAVTKKHVLIMDEVDGMAGNEDRGGIQELIALIKDSSVPIICMCNDRNHQKMRSLVNYCYDLRFNKPRLQQIKGHILSICCKEKFKIEPAKVEEIITATNNDIRQSINHISLLSAGKDFQPPSSKTDGKTAEKDLKLGPWEVVRKVFSADEHKNMNFNDKCDLFFHDYSLGPLFVQQNYLQVSPAGPKSEVTHKVALTADALSLGDLVDKRIRSNSAWSLLPTQAVFSSVMPGTYMSGHFHGQINFPGWLGKNSRSNKRNRLAQEIHDHTRLRTSGSRQSIRLDYAPFLLNSIVRPLKESGLEGVSDSLKVLQEYHLLREDVDSLIELTTWPGKKGPMDAVDGRVKAALTRAYNKETLAYSYSVTAGVKKKKAEVSEESELLGLEDEEGHGASLTDDEEDDNLENDGLIKTKKQSSSAATGSKPSTSKAKGNTATAKKTTKKPTASKPKK